MNKLAREIGSGPCPLLGAASYIGDPAFVEIAAHLGYRAMWFEMEHMLTSFREAAGLCALASGLGMLTMIRIPDASRENVLRSAECGPDILDLPMVNNPEVAREFVAHAKYAPVGNRGLFGASRASRYTILGSVAEEQNRINEDLCLMVQIETRESASRADEICAVPGIDAIFLGPGDMSASFGVPGDTKDPRVRDALCTALRAAERHGLIKAMMSPLDEVGFWTSQGVELIFITSDVQSMKMGARSCLEIALSGSAEG